MNFVELARKRYSCRKFSNKPVEQEKIDKIIECALCAPTGVNFQPFKIWVIKSESAIGKLSKVTPFLFDAKCVIAVEAVPEKSFVREFDGKNFADIDASIVATHIMLTIHDLGLGTTWVGYFDPKVLKKEFPNMDNIVALFPIGYPADDAKPSPMHEQSKSIDELVEEI